LTKKGLRRLTSLMLPVLLMLTATLSSGCTEESGPQNQTEAPNQQAGFFTPRKAFELIQINKTNPNFVVIDDRPQSEFNDGHIAGAVSVPNGPDFADRLGKLNKNKTYLVYCPTGCGATSRTMKQLGFKNVYEIEGGLQAWMAEGLPIQK